MIVKLAQISIFANFFICKKGINSLDHTLIIIFFYKAFNTKIKIKPGQVSYLPGLLPPIFSGRTLPPVT